MASSLGPGDRIEARCTRCNDVTGHVIIVLVGGEIIKVECRACGSVHKYHPPVPKGKARTKEAVCRVKPGQDRKGAVESVQKPTPALRGEARVTAAARKAAVDTEEAWRRSLNATVASPKAYAMDAVFEKGDLLEHPVFGQGVVQSVPASDRVQVLFREGQKLLRCGS